MKTPREELHDRIEGLCYNIQGKMDSPLSASNEINREVDAYVAALPAPEPKFEWHENPHSLESYCKIGHWMLLTMPYGRWGVCYGTNDVYGGRDINPRQAAEAWARENILIQRF
jgi:hypothetical protein